jgi:hypothetical protein
MQEWHATQTHITLTLLLQFPATWLALIMQPQARACCAAAAAATAGDPDAAAAPRH